MLTSSNYDDDKKKVTGGRNGYGAKLANIFSTEFMVETGDAKRGRTYKQVWKDNMGVTGEPIIRDDSKAVDFTRVTFYPDLRKFTMEELEEDIVALFCKRAYDIAGLAGGKVRVSLNGKPIKLQNFGQYVDLYLKNEEHKDLPRITMAKSDRWEVFCSLSDGAFGQVSFVNSICTTKGGTHVEYIANQIVAEISKQLMKKDKKL